MKSAALVPERVRRESLLNAVCANATRLNWSGAPDVTFDTGTWSATIRLPRPGHACAVVHSDSAPNASDRVAAKQDVLEAILAGRASFFSAVADREIAIEGDDWAALRLSGLLSAPETSPAAAGLSFSSSWSGDIAPSPAGAPLHPGLEALMEARFGGAERRTQMAVAGSAAKLRHHSPWYRRLAANGGDDVLALPVTTREDLVHFNEDLDLASRPGILSQRTSGTTGDRLRIHRTAEDLRQLVGRYLLVTQATATARQPVVGFLDPGIDLCRVLPAIGPLRPVAANLESAAQARQLREGGCEAIYAFPAVLRRLAVALVRRGESLPQVRLIWLAGDFVDAPLRKLCAQAFPAASAFATYGCTETGLLAYECGARAGYHLCESTFTAAVRRADGATAANGTGELLISSGAWGGTPILAYALGDEVDLVREPCACGLRAVRLVVHGRSSGARTEDGALIGARAAATLLADIDEVAAFQLHLDYPETARLLVETVTLGPLSDKVRAAARSQAEELLGPRWRVTVEPATLAGTGAKVPLIIAKGAPRDVAP